MEINNDKLNFETFKQQLLKLIEKNGDNKDTQTFLIKELEDCEDEKELFQCLEMNAADVYVWLGGEDPDDVEYEHDKKVDRLEKEISDLEDDIDRLEDEVEYAENGIARFNGFTLNDEYRVNSFLEYRNDFTPIEFETLLKNGKELLNK